MRWLFAVTALVLAAEPAAACDCVRFIPDNPRAQGDVAAWVEGAAVIAEGVIERPMGDLLEPAVFRPTRILRGPRAETYRIGVISDCALTLRAGDVALGRPIRLILYGGPELYEASRCVNLLGPEFERAVDRQLACSAARAPR